MQTPKTITSQSQAHLSKLKSKRTQLENLLRSRERLDYEIKNLKKSIQKDQKRIQKEQSMFFKEKQEVLTEGIVLTKVERLPKEELMSGSFPEDEDPDEIISLLAAQKIVLQGIFELLFNFGEQ